MEEKILTNKKHGMRTLLLCVLVELVAIAGLIYSILLDETGSGAAVFGIFGDEETAEKEGCQIEHVLSENTFELLKKAASKIIG